MITEKIVKYVGIAKEMAVKAGVPLEKALTMIEVIQAEQTLEFGDKRSQPHEKEIIGTELGKLDPVVLRNSDSRELANLIVQNGGAIRPNVQGVLSVISRKRKQLLLTDQRDLAQAAE